MQQRRTGLSRLGLYLRGHWGRVGVLAVIAMLGASGPVVGLLLVQDAIDNGMKEGDTHRLAPWRALPSTSYDEPGLYGDHDCVLCTSAVPGVTTQNAESGNSISDALPAITVAKSAPVRGSTRCM